VAEKRAEIDKKVDEKIATDRRKIIEEKRGLMKKRLEKEKLLGLLQTKQKMTESAKTWEANSKRRAQFCQTETKPVILWAPKSWNDKTNDLKSVSHKLEKALLKERRQEWEKFDDELDEEISQIREANDFDDNDLTLVNGKAKIIDKEDARNIIRKVDNSVSEPINKRLVITKTVNNDTRRVKPRDDDREKKSKKERRKEIEIKRKRRHGSSSSDDASEEEYVERKTPIITKDVRRIAAKDSGDDKKEETIEVPVNRRRITVKAPRQSDSSKSEHEKAKRRRVTRGSDNSDSELKKPIKTRKRSDTSESEPEPSPPPRRRSRGRR